MSAIVTSDERGTVLFTNIAAQRLFGYSADELKGANVSLLMPEPYRSQHASYMSRYMRTGQRKVLGSTRTVVGLRKDGKLLKITLRLSELKLDDKTTQFIAVLEREKNSGVRVFTNREGVITRISRNVEKAFGYLPHVLIGQNVSMLCPEPHRSRHDMYLQHYRATGESKVLGRKRILQARRIDGASIPILLEVKEAADGFIGLVTPICDKVEVMLTVSEETGRIEFASPQSKLVFGRGCEQMGGLLIDDLFCKSLKPSKLPLDGTLFVGEVIAADGSIVNVVVEAGSVDGNARVRRVCVMARGNCAGTLDEDDDSLSSDSVTSIDETQILRDQEQSNVAGHYEFNGVLGSGFCGVVRKARHCVSNADVAVKTINRSQCEAFRWPFPPTEVDVMRSIPAHPNIVSMLDLVETQSRVYMILELASGGDLFDYCARRGPLSEDEAHPLFTQLLRGVSWLHKNGIVHRDIKLENCILDENLQLKLIDMGFAAFYTESTWFSTFCGSPDFAAPELYLRIEYRGPPVDVWAVGVVLFSMLTGYVPFNTPTDLVKGKFGVPDNIKHAWHLLNLFEVIFCPEPDGRPTIAELRAHPWVQLPSAEEVPEDPHDAEIVHEVAKLIGSDVDHVKKCITARPSCNSIAASYSLLKKQQRRN